MAFHLKKVHPSSQSCSRDTWVFCSNQLWHQHRWQRVPDGMGFVAEPCTVGVLRPVQLWVQRDFPQELRAPCAVLASLMALAVGKVRVGPTLQASPGVLVCVVSSFSGHLRPSSPKVTELLGLAASATSGCCWHTGVKSQVTNLPANLM